MFNLGMMIAGLVGLLILLGIIAALFYIFRSFMLWYWKVDQIVERLESIDNKLSRLK